jgi:membrane protein
MPTPLNSQLKSNSSWLAILKQTAVEWSDDDAMTWSAALACYTLLALAPMLVLAVRFLSVFLSTHLAHDQIQSQAQAWMGPTAGPAITQIVDKASQPGSGLAATIVSIVVAIVSVGGLFAELQQAMNRIWKVKPKPGRATLDWLESRLLSLIVLIVSALLLLASIVATAWVAKLTASLGVTWSSIAWVVDLVGSIIVLTLIFALVYRTLPDADIEWRTTWVGASLSAILFWLGKYGLSLYFKYASPASAFGAVGSLAAVLIWIYYSSMIVFFGAEFTQIFAHRATPKRSPNAMKPRPPPPAGCSLAKSLLARLKTAPSRHPN